jgi:hypothetical protein
MFSPEQFSYQISDKMLDNRLDRKAMRDDYSKGVAKLTYREDANERNNYFRN